MIWRRAAAALLLVPLLGACAVHGLAFRKDERISIVHPGDRAKLTVPFALQWRIDHGASLAAASGFGVVIDRSPPPPDKTLAWLFRDDQTCGHDGCPDATYRADRGVFATTKTTLAVAAMPANGDRRKNADHEATVFLLDRNGRRIGESAWTVEFTVKSVDE